MTMEKKTMDKTTGKEGAIGGCSKEEEQNQTQSQVETTTAQPLQIVDLIQPLPPATRATSFGTSRPARDLPPGAYFTNANFTQLTPAGKTPLNVLGAELRMANKEDQVFHPQQRQRQQQLQSDPSPEASPPPQGLASRHLSSSQLLVANLVDEDAEERLSSVLPLAEEYDPEATENNSTSMHSKSNKENGGNNSDPIMERPWMPFVVGVLLVAGLTMLLVFTLADDAPTQATTVQDPFGDNAGFASQTQATPAPLSLEERILMLLPEYTQRQITETEPTAPQVPAYEWILNDPAVEQYSDARIQQRFALATLYFSTCGHKWTENDNWLDYGVHECDWFRKPTFALKETLIHVYDGYLDEIFPLTEAAPATCDQNGFYRHLWLDQNNLIGSIPEELYLLTSLQSFSIGLNALSGSISTQLGLLTKLEALAIYFQQNSQTIPSEIGLLTDLRVVGLNDNDLHGTVPSEVWQLTTLETFIISRNYNLKGSIPTEIETFSKLKWFVIEECAFSGTLPTELGQIESLEWLVFGGNHISGPVPAELSEISNLLIISAYENMLQGTLPSELGLLTAASLLSFRENMMTGTIPTEFGRMTSLTKSLNFEENQFWGTLPTELGNLGALYDMTFFDNGFTGTIPTEYGLLTSMGNLVFANNSLTGKIPNELSNMQQTRTLYLLRFDGNNLLSGTIPEALCTINATCHGNSLVSCHGGEGLVFGCSSRLCGCDCPCNDNPAANDDNSSTIVIIPPN